MLRMSCAGGFPGEAELSRAASVLQDGLETALQSSVIFP